MMGLDRDDNLHIFISGPRIVIEPQILARHAGEESQVGIAPEVDHPPSTSMYRYGSSGSTIETDTRRSRWMFLIFWDVP